MRMSSTFLRTHAKDCWNRSNRLFGWKAERFYVNRKVVYHKMIIFASMKEFDINIRIKVKQEDELSAMESILLDKARQATYRSYSPYSRFSVGAAVELEDGSILTVYYQKYRDPVTGEYDQKPCILCTHWTL